jgi:drug/metabolite transporter (DMT)-like permease
VLYFFITLIFFSSIEVVSKDLMNYLGPFEMTFFRFFIGLTGLLIFAFFKGLGPELRKFKKNDYALTALLGFINIFFSMTMLQYAIKFGEPAVVALIISSNPIFVYLFSLFLKHEIFSLQKAGGFVLGLAGIASVIVRDFGSLKIEKGALFALIGAVSFAVFTILNKKAVSAHSPLTVNIYSFSFGLIFIAIFFALTGGVNLSAELFDSPVRVIKIFYLGIFVTAISYITFLTAIKKIGPVASSLVFLFKPAVATILAVIFLSEEIRFNLFLGLILSSLGSYMIMKKNKPRVQQCAQSA